ncbi:MAG: thermonuclease family protein [Lentisphaeria bacterium]|nr:thermonuclease family protein [Lentisphaeria bacterium]
MFTHIRCISAFVFYWDAVVGVAEVYKQGCTSFFVVFPLTPKETATVKKLILLSLLVLSISTFSAEITGKVIGVTDGDTVTVSDDMDQGKFRIRLDKIDAPEKKQAFGNKSKQYLSGLIFGKKVSVRFKAVDRYGRILGVIYLDGTEINLLMVQNGYAWHYSYFDQTQSYIEAEKQAKSEKKGLWQDPNPINPYQFRQQNKKR